MDGHLFKTRLTVEIEVEHWDTTNPQRVLEMVRNTLKFPAVTDIKLVSAESNYVLHGEPKPNMEKVDLK